MRITWSSREILLGISFALALSALAPWMVGDRAILLCFVTGPAWLVLAAVILVRHRLRGLWVLFGLPFVFIDLFYALLIWACSHHQGCL